MNQNQRNPKNQNRIKIETYWNVNVFEEHTEESFDELK